MLAKALTIQGKLKEWRRHLHMHPELSFQEAETAKYVESILRNYKNVKVEKGVGYPTAIVASIHAGNGPVFAIRADMDALPIQEENEVDYKSIVPGVMHACGHDAHTAILLGAVHLLSEYFEQNQIQGTVKFLFQPAEEHVDEHGLSGAAYMVRAGVLDDSDGVIALHMNPESPYGEVWIHDGYSMSNVDVFRGEIKASGGHGAYPHLGTDPIYMLSLVLQHIYSLTGRRLSPLDAGVVSVGKIQSGATSNVIPSSVNIEGTIRSFKPEVRKKLFSEVENAFSIVKNFGGEYDLQFIQEDPALYNDPEINRLLKEVIHSLQPDIDITDKPFGLGGEDFAHMTRKKPGAMFFLGCSLMDDKVRNLHTPHFNIDERVLPLGAAIFAETAIRFLTRKNAENRGGVGCAASQSNKFGKHENGLIPSLGRHR